jgi:hypothetical protein
MTFPKLTGAVTLALAVTMAALPTVAGEADVVAAQATRSGAGVYRFAVTVRHADTGWEHYAEKWDIVAPDGTVLATRTLLHPHEDEQPFTRSLDGVAIPDTVDHVVVRAHDKVDGYGGAEVRVDMTAVR